VRYNPVGTGPFKFVSYQQDTVIKYQKFDGYWQKGKPYLDAIEVYQIPDALTRAATFQSGEMDAICGDLTQVEYRLVQQGGNVVKAPTGVAFLMGDSKNTNSPFSNLKVRQAIDYAVDRDKMAQAIGYGFYQTDYELSFPGSKSYFNDITIRAYNPEMAKQLLTEAGYPNGFSTQIIASQANTPKDAAVAVQSFLSKIGVQAELKYIDQGSWTSYYVNGWSNALMMALFGLDANINKTYISRFVPTNQYNSLARSDDFMKLIQASINSVDFDPTLAQKVTRYIYDNALINCLYATPRGAVMRDYVKDTGFLAGQSWPIWYPADVWFNK
jgi:ABC-type transport system substrate-binding protein